MLNKIKHQLERILPQSWVFRYNQWKSKRNFEAWQQSGGEHLVLEDISRELHPDGVVGVTLPATRAMKNEAMRDLRERFGCKIFVETGTFLGDTIAEQLPYYEQVMSIELNEALWKKAQGRFASHSHVKLLCGDSGEVLKQIVPTLTQPALFWLDGHYSGGITARGFLETPIVAELITISKSPLPHVMLIDDARLFNGQHDYPSMPQLDALVAEYFPHYLLETSNDMIRLFPKP